MAMSNISLAGNSNLLHTLGLGAGGCCSSSHLSWPLQLFRYTIAGRCGKYGIGVLALSPAVTVTYATRMAGHTQAQDAGPAEAAN